MSILMVCTIFGFPSSNRHPKLDIKFITLSSSARRVPFEYLQIYLNKKGKACKVRVNEWIIIQV